MRLAACVTHPIQYVAPVLRHVQRHHGIEVVALYGSDFSVAGYKDKEFGATFRWDTDLLSGYTTHFLSRTSAGGPTDVNDVVATGIEIALSRYRPDAILITGYQGKFHRGAMNAAARTGAPLLLRAETTDHALRRSILKNWGRDLVLRWWYRHFAVFLPIGTYSRRHYKRLAPHKPQVLSPYCVDTDVFQPEERARATLRQATRDQIRLNDTHIAVLLSGKLIPKKNPLLLVEAAKQLPDLLRERVVLVFLGDGELQGQIDTLAQATPSIQVRFLGFQNQTVLSQYYHAADLLVLPSAWGETWGLVVNEALHHGLPVVVSDQVGCTPDLVQEGKTGFIFPSNSSIDLRNALEQAFATLIRKPEIRTICREVVGHYTIADAAAGIVEGVRVARGVV